MKEVVEFFPDGPPAQVALELLSDPRARLTNPFRKTLQAARARHFVSTRKPKPLDARLASKTEGATFAQLGKWLKRSITRRRDCQAAFLRITGTTPVHDRLRAALELKAAQHDAMRDACEIEIAARKEKQAALRADKELETAILGEV